MTARDTVRRLLTHRWPGALFTLRAIGLAATFAAAASCTDATTAPIPARVARVSFRPTYTALAQSARASLPAFSLVVNNVRIRISAPGPVVVLDTTLYVPTGVDSVSLAATVLVTGATQDFVADLALRADSTVVFTGQSTFTLGVGSSQTPPLISVPITFVGPGASARRVVIAGPRDTTVAGATTLRYSATALDSAGRPVTAAEVAWFIAGDSTLATVSSTGQVTTAGRRGGFFVGARTLGGLRDSVHVVAATTATSVVLLSGSGQTAMTGTQLPTAFSVRVTDASGTALPGVPVTFQAQTAGGVFTGGASSIVIATDNAGVASSTVVLGSTPGTYRYDATIAGGTSASITATAVPGTVTQVALRTAPGGAVSGITLATQPVVELRDQFGALTDRGGPVTVAVTSGSATLGGVTTVPTVNGVATFSGLSLTGAGPVTLTFSVPNSASVSASVTVGAGPAGIGFTARSALLTVGSRGSTTAIATDASGAGIASVALIYASRNPAIATVDSTGGITATGVGQATIVVAVRERPGVTDSMRVVVTQPGGIAIVSSLDRFAYDHDSMVTMSVFVDLSNSTSRVGSATIDVTWAPTGLMFQSYAASSSSGVSPVVNSTNAANGTLRFSFINPSGVTGRVEVLRVTYRVGAAGTPGTLGLSASEVSSTDYVDLLPLTFAATYLYQVR
jgi:hypothetical protein